MRGKYLRNVFCEGIMTNSCNIISLVRSELYTEQHCHGGVCFVRVYKVAYTRIW